MTATAHTLIAETKTYNEYEAADRGYDVEVYEGFAILTRHTCWQGETAGTTYKAQPPADVIAAAKREEADEDHGFEPDLDAAVQNWLSTADPDDWTVIRKGFVIR